MSSDGERNKAGMWSRTSVCRPRVHLIETALDEGRGDHLDERGAKGLCNGTRLVLLAVNRKGLVCKIETGKRRGQRVVIPRASRADVSLVCDM